MKLETTDEVHDLMEAYISSAALGTALELGLFWLLDKHPLDVEGVAQSLGIPINRCRYWLQLLSSIGLLEGVSNGYAPSSVARNIILETYSQETWAFLAQGAREHLPAVHDLALHIKETGSTWIAQGLTKPEYVSRMTENPERARRFTRMLYEIHLPFAEKLANSFDMDLVDRLMDLGGGSGVVSMALLRRYPQLTAVVVDVANVCTAGREIAIENSMEERITYHPANFLNDELPTGFDMVLECDVGVQSEELFRKLRSTLNPGGRLVIVDLFAPEPGLAPASRLGWALRDSLADEKYMIPTSADIQTQLTQAGFQPLSEDIISGGWIMIVARK